ncbi:MAG: TonB-dependent receptor [Alphaproteobacteria bacterium]|nr:TonB-dependent receptor [Alphaproteobacteria bacterium]
MWSAVIFLATSTWTISDRPALAQQPARNSLELPAVTITAPQARAKPRPLPARPLHSQRAAATRAGQSGITTPPAAGDSSGGTAAPGSSPTLAPTAASAQRFTGTEINAVPFSRVGEALELVPGLIVTQHSGEGKANQYFLRGFNLDHGTDLAISLDGMPVNMVTHGHGQGYADINFLIPELIRAASVRKGPYYADVGDFGSAGAVGIDYVDKLPKNLAEISFGSFGWLRALAAASHKVGDGNLLVAADTSAYNGPWEVPDRVRKISGVLRYASGTATDGVTLSAMAYSNVWTSTDQVAQRAIDSGLINRFGTLDPSDGGLASRFSLSGSVAQSGEYGETKVSAYVIRSALQLFNDFTYDLNDPVHGDQFSQLDRRTLGGFDVRHSFDWNLAGFATRTRVGVTGRYDDIHVALYDTEQRALLSVVRDDHVNEGSVALWSDSTTRWNHWLRTSIGLREDWFAGRVASDTAANSGSESAAMTSPKAGIVLGPWFKTEFYGNAGFGLHSNDLRGSTITVDPTDKTTPLPATPLLVRSRGAELGIRTTAVPGLTSSLSVFLLDFDSELLFVGDAGTTEASRPSRRIGVEWTNHYKPTPLLSFDLDVAYTHARFSDFDPAGAYIPGAPAVVASAGLTAGADKGWFAGVKARYFGPRPLIEDNSSRSLSSLVFNARAGYNFDNGLKVQLDVLNLFNANTNQIEYYYVSRLPGEPIDGVGDRHVHPMEPRAIRLTLGAKF